MAQDVSALHENVHAVGADDAYGECTDQTEPQATAFEGQWHRQNAGTQCTVEEIGQRFGVTARGSRKYSLNLSLLIELNF